VRSGEGNAVTNEASLFSAAGATVRISTFASSRRRWGFSILAAMVRGSPAKQVVSPGLREINFTLPRWRT